MNDDDEDEGPSERVLVAEFEQHMLTAIKNWLGKPPALRRDHEGEVIPNTPEALCELMMNLNKALATIGPLGHALPVHLLIHATCDVVAVALELCELREMVYAYLVTETQKAARMTLAEMDSPDTLKVVN